MSSQTCDVVTTLFKIICCLVVVFMIGFWLLKYQKDEDLCLVDYKMVQDLQDEHLPVMSLCYLNGILNKKLNQLGTTGTTYLSHLRGEVFDEKFNNLDFDEMTMNLTHYLAEIHVKWRNNDSLVKYALPNANLPVEIGVIFTGIFQSVLVT